MLSPYLYSKSNCKTNHFGIIDNTNYQSKYIYIYVYISTYYLSIVYSCYIAIKNITVGAVKQKNDETSDSDCLCPFNTFFQKNRLYRLVPC